MRIQFTHSDVTILDRKLLYQGRFRLEQLMLRHRLFCGGWSRRLLREVLERGEGVGVLLFDIQNNQLVLVEQFRVGALEKGETPWLLEIVAGIINHGENLVAVARRETEEETGLKIANLFPICQYWVSPGASTERIHLFCGQVNSNEAHGIHGLLKEGENIRLHVLDLRAVYNLLNEGKINNGATIIALQWLQLHEQKVRRVWRSGIP